MTAAVPSFNLVERDVFGHLLPRRVCRRPAEGGELPHRSEEPEAPTIGDGAQVQCSRSRDLQGAQNKTESSLIFSPRAGEGRPLGQAGLVDAAKEGFAQPGQC